MRSNPSTASTLFQLAVILGLTILAVIGILHLNITMPSFQSKLEPLELEIAYDPALSWLVILNLEDSLTHNCRLSSEEAANTVFPNTFEKEGPLSLPFEAPFHFTVNGNPATASYEIDGLMNFWDEPVFHSHFKSCSVNGYTR